jgi:HK97 family phage prohead protease
MRLAIDAKGLRYEIDVPDTQMGRDVVTMIGRGDLSGSSFAFIPKRVTWIEEETRLIRVLEDVQLYDTGPVTYPAYEATSTGLRAAESQNPDLLAERFRWQQKREAARVRSRMAEVFSIES